MSSIIRSRFFSREKERSGNNVEAVHGWLLTGTRKMCTKSLTVCCPRTLDTIEFCNAVSLSFIVSLTGEQVFCVYYKGTGITHNFRFFFLRAQVWNIDYSIPTHCLRTIDNEDYNSTIWRWRHELPRLRPSRLHPIHTIQFVFCPYKNENATSFRIARQQENAIPVPLSLFYVLERFNRILETIGIKKL